MKSCLQGTHPGKANVVFLPFIDLSASYPTCIYSTLKFISSLSEKHQFHPVITFDQPLYWKAMKIVKSNRNQDISRIIVKLGGFHTMMSFIGSIGHIMDGSGLQEVLEQIYASDSVVHMLSGKAIARAIRGLFIVECALYYILLKEIVNESQHGVRGVQPDLTISQEERRQLLKLVDNVTTIEDFPVNEVVKDSSFKKLQTVLSLKIDKLSQSKTAKLWIQLLEMISLLKLFIRADRTSDWVLHLQTISDMLPFFAASGHNNYTKSLMVYHQDMSSLEEQRPSLYRSYMKGEHTIRRSDNPFWGGLPADLVIEQDLMRSMKSNCMNL
jgi:hypothetical protein